MCELALCAEKGDTYSVSYDVDEILEKSGCIENINLIHADFLEVEIAKKIYRLFSFHRWVLEQKKVEVKSYMLKKPTVTRRKWESCYYSSTECSYSTSIS